MPKRVAPQTLALASFVRAEWSASPGATKPAPCRIYPVGLTRRNRQTRSGDRGQAQPVLATLVILPARRQPVHTLTRLGEPLMSARTR